MSIIELKNVSFSYNKDTDAQIDAVKNVSFSINEGEFVALLGHNGSGKSTIAKLLNGLLLPSSGSILIDGKDTSNEKNLFEIRSKLGIVFQNPDNQMVTTIIEDDVAFGPENLGLPPEEIRNRVDWALKSVGMYEYREGTPHRLSGGQKQRVAIAGVLAIMPKIIVLDEATSMLDPIGRKEVLKVITRLNKENKMTVIMITHYMEEAALADRIIVMNDGEVVLDGGHDIFKQEEIINKAGLTLPLPAIIANMLNKKGLSLSKGLVTIEKLVDELCR